MTAGRAWTAVAAGVLCALGAGAAARAEPIVGGPCEGCDTVLLGMPETLDWSARIAPEGTAGEPMRIDGRVRDADGRPVAGVVVYAYHTDGHGIYPGRDMGSAEHRHGRLRGWARTDAEGRYRFDTIRPAGYPNSTIPAHVHMHVLEPGRCTYYIGDLLFSDDERLDGTARRGLDRARGGSGLADPRRDEDGTWLVTRDIVLGQGVPGYEDCDRGP